MPSEDVANGAIVADNDSVLRGILRSLLVPLGYTVFLAADGIEAVAFARRMVPRLIILDLQMPRLNGLCTCEQIRVLPGYARVPILILTVYDGWDTREAARRAGATAFFVKPFKPADLLRGILTLMATADGPAPPEPEPSAWVWKRQDEPTPAYGETPELSRGRHVLNIYRR